MRDVYSAGEYLVIVATDRLSAFDYILPTPIPDKGRVLTAMTLFWLELLRACPHLHIMATSRHVLGVAGEVTVVVRPMSVPPMRVPPMNWGAC